MPRLGTPEGGTTQRRNARGSPVVLATLLVVVLLTAPTGVAYHLSVGAEDTAGLVKGEPPADVPTGSDAWQRGTKTNCEDPDPEDPATLQQDAFCGALVYNQGSTNYTALSPEDQTSLYGVEVDLQMATYVGAYGISRCEPWCNAEGAYDALHEAGSFANLTPPPDRIDDGGTQSYGGNVYAVSPMQAYELTGNSWLLPVTDTSFVAFVEDAETGKAIGGGELGDYVAQAGLPGSAQAKVCVFTPQAHIGTHAASESRCEVELAWMGEEGTGGEACSSPTYLCGENEPAWRGTTMCPMWHAACYLSDAWNSAHHFAIWHAVVAPSLLDCGVAEPGFDQDPSTFLAHDLDVYEPPTDETPAQGVPHYWDQAAEFVPGLGPLREGRAPDVADNPAGRELRDSEVFTQHEPEPNAPGEEWLGIEESSHTVTKDREIDECIQLATDETEPDPWVNVVDAHVTREAAGFGVPAGEEPEPDHDPKPSMRITGHLGLFTDVDDDGRYEQAPASEKLESYERHGAYPLIWDHHAPGEGCEFRSGTTIGDLATEAGYEEPTGLAVTLRISDATLIETRTGQTHTVLGPTAVVFLSEGLDPEQHGVVQDAINRTAGDRPVLEIDNAFQPQCGEPTGGFTSTWEIHGEPLEGDGLAAAAILTVGEGRPGGDGTAVPPSPIDLSGDTHTWWDVDPFEGALEG